MAHLAVRTATPSLSVDAPVSLEGDSGEHDASFTVTLAPASDQTVTVDFATAQETATEGEDYAPVSGTLTFAPGETEKTVSVPVIGDTVVEDDETFYVVLSNPDQAVIGDGLGSGTIRADDYEVSADPVAVLEGQSGVTQTSFVLSVRPPCRDLPCPKTVTVDYATSDGTAAAGSDYLTVSGTLTFTPGSTTQTAGVTVVGDRLAEDDEVFYLVLSNPPPGVTLIDPVVNGTILDDDRLAVVEFAAASFTVRETDGHATISVRRSGSLRSGTSIDYQTIPGSALAGADYTSVHGTLRFGESEGVATFQVPVVYHAIPVPDKKLTLRLSNPGPLTAIGPTGTASLTILRAGPTRVGLSSPRYTVAEAGRWAWLTATVSGTVAGSVSVEYTVSPGTAQEGVDYEARSGILQFTPLVRVQRISIPILDDKRDESDETFSVRLINPVGTDLGPISAAVVTIRDDDAGGLIQLGAASYSVAENASSLVVMVVRSGGTAGGVTVAYTTVDGTATAGQDYATTSGTLTFAAGQLRQTLAIPILNDVEAEGWETLRMTISNPTGGAKIWNRQSAEITIVDDEQVVEFAATRYTVGEGRAVFLTVRRTGDLSGVVTVPYATQPGTAVPEMDYAETTGTLTIAPFLRSQRLLVRTLDDGQREPSETFSVRLGAPAGADLGHQTDAVVTIDDNDPFPDVVRFAKTEHRVPESNSLAWMKVTRTGAVLRSFTVEVRTLDVTASAGSDYQPIAGVLSFGPGETVKTFPVQILDDSEAEETETLVVTLDHPTGGVVFGGAFYASVLIEDDDGTIH